MPSSPSQRGHGTAHNPAQLRGPHATETSPAPAAGGRRECFLSHSLAPQEPPPPPSQVPGSPVTNMVSALEDKRQQASLCPKHKGTNKYKGHHMSLRLSAVGTPTPPPPMENKTKARTHRGEGTLLSAPPPSSDRGPGGWKRSVWCLQMRDGSRSSRMSVLGLGTFHPHPTWSTGPRSRAWGSLLHCTQGRRGCWD